MSQLAFDFPAELNRDEILKNLRRDFCGYLQVRECPASPWKFCVHSIEYIGSYCTCKVMLFSGGVEKTGINGSGQILVFDKWYSKSQWTEVQP